MLHRASELAARGYVFVLLNVYGLGKMAGGQFYRRGELPADVAATPLGEASAFQLAWCFMGYSPLYIAFVGVTQVVGAWMLLWGRTRLLGALILLPVMINVVVFDVIFLDMPGALASASIYTSLLVAVLALNAPSVRRALVALTVSDRRTRDWRVFALALALMAALFGLDQLLVNWLGHGEG